ncbi:MAG: hypothetical protein M1820_009867 [Bogoriella megaspora]|nr:MAG: hypothetical protein M1820_009867 [Bogoriella megaspora]
MGALAETIKNSHLLKIEVASHSQLQALASEAHDTLQELDHCRALLDQSSSSSQRDTQQSKLFGEIKQINKRLKSYSTRLSAINNNLKLSSDVWLRDRISYFVKNVNPQAQSDPDDSESFVSAESLSQNQRQDWRTIRKALEKVGITAEVFIRREAVILPMLEKCLREQPSSQQRGKTHSSQQTRHIAGRSTTPILTSSKHQTRAPLASSRVKDYYSSHSSSFEPKIIAEHRHPLNKTLRITLPTYGSSGVNASSSSMGYWK